MSYVIAGRKIGSEWLSIGTLTTFFGAIAYATSGPSKAKTEQLKKETPPIEASGADEESFILKFIKEEEEKAKSASPVAEAH